MLVVAVVIAIMVGGVILTTGYAMYQACEQLELLQPELSPTWTFWNGCMVINPYTGYLQGLSDWSASQNYLELNSDQNHKEE